MKMERQQQQNMTLIGKRIKKVMKFQFFSYLSSATISIFLLFSVVLFNSCQIATYKCTIPLEAGVIHKRQFAKKDNEKEILKIVSNKSQIKSFIAGKVFSIFNAGNGLSIVLGIDSCYYSFSNFDTVFVKKGDTVNAGDKLGISKKDGERYVLYLKKICNKMSVSNDIIFHQIRIADKEVKYLKSRLPEN